MNAEIRPVKVGLSSIRSSGRDSRRIDAMSRELPDARDGLTRKERVVLWTLSALQKERGDRHVPLPMLYGRVLEHIDMSIAELQEIVARLGAR